MKIALDVLGGDNAPKSNLVGVKDYLERYTENPAELILLGNKEYISKYLKSIQIDQSLITIINTTQEVGIHEKPSRIFKEKPDSSLVRSIQLLKENKVDAVLSAGNTGALLATSLFLLGKIPNIRRPAFAPYIPTRHGGFILCDAGANPNSKPLDLVQCALMASAYTAHLNTISNPSVSLLNIGKEENKGNDLIIQTYPLLKKHLNNFIGNLEPRYIMEGKADVVIADGFTGNIVLKLTEGVFSHIIDWFHDLYFTHVNTEQQSSEFLSILKEIQNSLDHEEYGATPLLGINGLVMKCHGSSTSRGISNSIYSTQKAIEDSLLENIENNLAQHMDLTQEAIINE
tara:strand:+ start:87 stop:1118 length:1032 start_codon:yes stop_codon:yes gene_type:complete